MVQLGRASVLALLLWGSRGAPAEENVDEAEDGEDEVEMDLLTEEQELKIHKGMDRNSDGKVSLMEVMEYAAHMRKLVASRDIKTVSDEMDTNKDNKLSLEEVLKDIDQWSVDDDEEDKKLQEARRKLEAEKFHAADDDGDGFLEYAEIPALFYPETNEKVITITATATMREKDKDGDGLLTPMEFWEGDVVEDKDMVLSEEEKKDFTNLDRDGSGKLDLQELKAWESGVFHTEEAMKKFIELADTDGDMHVTHEEMKAAREQIGGSDAQYHLMEWAEHAEL